MFRILNRTPLPTCACLALTMALTAPAILADARSDGERGIEEYRRGNLIEGMRLLEKSATEGYTPAQTTLAFILDAAEEDEQAFHWYQQATTAGDPAGMFGLGGMYAKGEGTEKDPKRAGELIEQAAELGHVLAMRLQAHAFEHGQLGFSKQPQRAAEWYRKAAEAGDELSMRRMQQAYAAGELELPVDPAQAEAWAEKIESGQ